MFYIEHKKKNIIGVIPINGKIDMDKIYDELNLLDLESKYGIHDGSGGEKCEIDNSIYHFDISFMTYEVRENKISELMSIWKSILDKLGYVTNDIIIREENEFSFK